MTTSRKFQYDGNVSVLLPDHPYSAEFAQRNVYEITFRRINTFLITRGFIRRNVLDAGCWVGDNAVPWAKVLGGRVYAIDPSPTNCAFVRSVKELNKLENLVVIQEALADSQKRVSTDEDLHHCKLRGDDSRANKIDTTSIDLLFWQKKIEDLGYIHLDVEGMEREIIQGADHVLRTCRPVLTFEQHLESDDYVGLVNHLKGRRYVTYLINETLEGCRQDCRNFLALPLEAPRRGFEWRVNTYLETKNVLRLLTQREGP